MALDKLVIIIGQTGTGKTEASLNIAQTYNGEVINCDSRQMYKGLDIVTAQPSAEEQAVCPHKLFGFLDPIQAMDAGTFSVLGTSAIEETLSLAHLPLLVGGTGMYLDALLYGLAPIADVPEDIRFEIQQRYEQEGGAKMWAYLNEIDPAYAAKIHPNDKQRVTRAIEVFESTGTILSTWHDEQAKREAKFDALKLGISMDLDELTRRLALRIDLMIEMGAVDEMKTAWEKTRHLEAPGFTGIGCRELLDHIHGRLSLNEAKSLWLKRTRAYAKRQMTWFKKDEEIIWFQPGQVDEMVLQVGEWL